MYKKIILSPFRLTKRQVEILLQQIGENLMPKRTTNHALSAEKKVLIALRFFASNERYYTIGNNQGIPPFAITTLKNH